MNKLTALLLIALAGTITGAAAAASWDGDFALLAKTSSTGTDSCLTLPSGIYTKVNCRNIDGGSSPVDAYVGVKLRQLDGGSYDDQCYLGDGGIGCDLVRFSMGEKFYRQTQAATAARPNRMCIAAGPGGGVTCEVFQGVP